jgi:hypothetical protein
LVEDREKWRKAIVQLPLGFVMQGGVKLSPGRWIRVKSLNREGIKPLWSIDKLDTRPLEDPVDVLEVLARIKGLPEKRPVLKVYTEKTA